MSLFPIFKVNKISENNKTDTIYVFFGNNLDIEDPDDLFNRDPENKAFADIFDEDELDNIKTQNIEVIFLTQSIHIDDSIGVIKLKIFEALQRTVSMSEIYLFCLKAEKINPITMYQNLTQNDYLPLTRVRLEQMLKNIYDIDGDPIKFGLPKKDKYSFDDILKLDLVDREYLVAKILGQKFVFNNEYPFIANPFLVSEYDTLLERSRRELTTLNNNLLLETVPIFKNTIYLCLAGDVFLKQELSIEYTSKIYYPFLHKDNIDTIDKLERDRTKLIESTTDKLTIDVEKGFENIDMFYDIFKYRDQLPSKRFSENPKKSGIIFIKIIIHPDFTIKIPIDVIFKLIHATKEFPLIKFNPETRQENIYRLYTEQLTADGRKIPFLNKAVIFKLMRNIGKGKSVAVYTNIIFKGIQYYIACEFEDNGTITVFPLNNFETPIMLDYSQNPYADIDNIISLAINPLIEQIKPFFEQSGLEIPLFKSIQRDNVEIRNLSYQTIYSITNPIDITKYIGCVSSVFTIESSNFKKGIEMRFKRVANFNKRDSQEAFIIEKIDQGLKFDEIVEELVQNYNDTNAETAADLIAKIRTELEVTRGANRRRALMIKINPGFKTLISLNSITSEITITVDGINNIYYLNTIPVYINTLVRISQDINSSKINASEINKLCSGKELDDIDFGEITSQSETSIMENKVPTIDKETPVYSKKSPDSNELKMGENMDDLLNMLGYDEDEVEDLEGVVPMNKGGKRSESSESEKSVSTENLSSVSSLSELSPTVEAEETVVSRPGPEATVETVAAPAATVEAEETVVARPGPEATVETVAAPAATVEAVAAPAATVEAKETVVARPGPEATVEAVAAPAATVEAEETVVARPGPEATVEAVAAPAATVEAVAAPAATMGEEIEIKPKKNKPKKKVVEADLENTVRDIRGMKLKYPNPFSDRLSKNAPQLFVREKNDKIDVYTRMCPFSLNDRRQPVILSKEEKNQLVEEHPDINQESDFIEYSTDPTDSSKKFYYTCPRFWCMLTDKMVTEKDILEGKCGPKVKRVEDAIIPKTADEIKDDGRYVYQFYDDKETKYPGFHKKKTPSGLCIPCCYSKWSTEEMKSRRDICQGKNDDNKSTTVSEEELKRNIQEGENYVKGPEKYGPQLGEHRWGFLPIVVQKFLHEVNDDCQVSKMNTSLKPNHTCILRHGVEINSQQSFIACIANALFYVQEDENTKKPLITKYIPNAKNDVPSIKEMKELIINAINIDKFIKYQNGDLITSFANQDLTVDINKHEYINSKLYKKIAQHGDNEINISNSNSNSSEDEGEDERSNQVSNKPLEFFTRVVQAYETFILFLRDNSINIDYTYLWDLVCMPNSQLFEAGINLIILEMPEDDITNNIELVCPSNRYSTHIYDARKRNLILLKRENYFEPIYGYRNDLVKNKILITKTFSEYDRNLPKTLRSVFTKIIKPTLGERCRYFESRPNEYKFKHPPLLDTLIETLIDKKYTILKQILNFQGKVIGLLTKNKKGLEGFVPCYPSSLTTLKNSKNKKNCDNESKCDYDFVYMSDNVWKPYEETLQFLKEYYDYKEKDDIENVECSDDNTFCRVVKDEQIIGFLTNTNQFVRIYDPIPVSSVDDNIKTFTNNDMLVADIETLTTTNVDTTRTNYIKRIQLETNFYNVFRNTIRILFNDYSNSEKRKTIQDECNKKYVSYTKQLDKVIGMLHDIVGDSIIFFTKGDKLGYDYKDINETDIHNCIKLSKNKCGENIDSGICRITDDKCTLLLPKNNLITDTDNEEFYYGRMADELIRYNRIKSFIFKPQAYLSFGQLKYNLRDNEILILQNLLNQEFFDTLIPADINKYAKYNTYDTAEPIISQKYKNDFELDDVINPNHVRNCFQSDPVKITSIFWKKCFPSNYTEVTYAGSNFCALYLIIDIVNEIKRINLTMNQVKEDLMDEYKRLTDNYSNRNKINTIINILREEGQYDANQLLDGTLNFEQMILHEGLLVKYKIPSIFISSKPIPETRFNRTEFVCYMDDENSYSHSKKHSEHQKFVFIFTPAMYRRKQLKNPEYKLIMNDDSKINISLDQLTNEDCIRNITKSIKIYHSIEEYIDVIFEKDNTTKYKKRRQGIRDIEFVIEGESIKESVRNEPRNNIEFDIQEEVERREEPTNKKKIIKIKKGKTGKKILLENAEEALEALNAANDQLDLDEPFEIEPAPKQQKGTKKRKQKINVNPHGKTKKKAPQNS